MTADTGRVLADSRVVHVGRIWLSPIFTSPMADFGYDVADYRDVDPIFGTLHDLDELIEACHARDIRIVLDWVPNHTSDRHAWFEESRSSRDNPKRDWYVWRDGFAARLGPRRASGAPLRLPRAGVDPTIATTRSGLPALLPGRSSRTSTNWDQPRGRGAPTARRAAVLAGPRRRRAAAWTSIHLIGKDPQLRNHVGASRRHDEDWESIHDRLRGIRRVIDEYDDRMIVGEVALQDLHRIVAYLGYGDQLHLAHNFVFIDQEWDAEAYATSIADFETLAADHSWPAWFLGNHDKPRPASRFNHDGLGPPRARAILVMLYALRGTPVHLPGRGAGPPGRRDPARTASSTSTAATPSARRCRGPTSRRTTAAPPATRGCHSVTEAHSLNAQNPSCGSALHAESGPAPGQSCGSLGRADAGRGCRRACSRSAARTCSSPSTSRPSERPLPRHRRAAPLERPGPHSDERLAEAAEDEALILRTN